MKYLFTAAVLALTASVANADPVEGRWQTETGETGGYLHVDISVCGQQICGVIHRVFDNADTSSQGKRIIWDMDPKGDGSYAGGRIWAPDADRTYRSKMKLNGNTLRVSGCVGPICRSQNWQRVN